MSFEEKNHICDDAELYYLTLIFGEEYGNVPEQIAAHVESCGYCKSRLEALKDLLAADDSDDNQLSNAQIDMLGLQFAYLGKKVDCAIVKPFLPSIAEPSLAVKIPTPITVHIDRCDSCKSDLAAIQAMALNSKQLNVLSSILWNDPSVETVDCSVAASAIKQYVELDWDKIEPDVAKHLCCCNVCQSLIYKLRAETIVNLRKKNMQTKFPCELISYCDVFDYCYPYGLVPYRDQYANFRKPFVDELKQCAECLQKVQDLHRLVYSVKQRLNSGIVTVYEVGESQKSEAATDINEVYEGFPVKVRAIEPICKQSKSDSEQDNTAVRRPGVTNKWFRHIAKAAVAAGIILAVSLFLLNTPTATAVTIQQVYNAIQKATNIHMQKFFSESVGPLQEKWVSKTLGIYAVKDENGFIVWDVPNELKYTRLSGFQDTETVSMTEMQLASIQKRIQGSLGLMPFENISQMPENAEWKELQAPKLEGISPVDTLAVELVWSIPTAGGSDFRFKWRGFIEKSTNRPLRTEFYRYNKNSGKYELETVDLIEYCTENQIRELLP